MSDRSKIIGINEAKSSSGMAHLIEQANPPSEQSARELTEPYLPPNKCLKVRVILDATDYYCEFNGFGQNTQPPFQFCMPVAYSLLPHPVGGVQRHDSLEIFATGIRKEVVDLPEWWSRRDAGVI